MLSIGKKASYMGLILDKKLSWQPTLDTRVNKAAIELYTCKRMVGPKLGPTSRVTYWHYTAIVRPIMMYSIVI